MHSAEIRRIRASLRHGPVEASCQLGERGYPIARSVERAWPEDTRPDRMRRFRSLCSTSVRRKPESTHPSRRYRGLS
jgi:hypothetical protein